MANGKAGRPEREFDKVMFERSCEIQCTVNEIEYVFHCDQRTLNKWCLRTYEQDFATCYKRFNGVGRASLRRAQFSAAIKGNATLLIWLGKQYLGQRDPEDEAVKAYSKGIYETITTVVKNQKAKDDRNHSIGKAA